MMDTRCTFPLPLESVDLVGGGRRKQTNRDRCWTELNPAAAVAEDSSCGGPFSYEGYCLDASLARSGVVSPPEGSPLCLETR